MGMYETAIGLMCKPPRAGISKTRLAASTRVEVAWSTPLVPTAMLAQPQIRGRAHG